MFYNKKVIIFDVDGTMLDTIGMWNDVDATLIDKMGGVRHDNIERERDDFFLKYLSEDMHFEYSKYLFEYSKYLKERYSSNLKAEKIHELRANIAMEYLINEVDFKDSADKFIKIAKSKGFILVIASLTTRKNIEIYSKQNNNIRSKCDIYDMFDLILLKDDIKKIKPDPEIYLKVLEILNVNPSECIILEDSLVGVQAGKSAGIDVINVYDKHSDKDRAKINELSDYYVKGYDELIEELENL